MSKDFVLLPSLRSWSSYSRSPSLPSPLPLMSIRDVSNIDDRKVSLPTWRKGELIGLRSCFFCEKSTFSLKGARIALPPLLLMMTRRRRRERCALVKLNGTELVLSKHVLERRINYAVFRTCKKVALTGLWHLSMCYHLPG